MRNIIKNTKYILIAVLLLQIYSCEMPENGIEAQSSVNANIVRFRIYQNQNIFFDGIIQEDMIRVTIPEGIDKTKIYPEILLSFGASVSPPSGSVQDFTGTVKYTVTSESKTATKTYEVIVNN